MSTITSHGAQGHGYKQEKRNKFIYIGPSMPSIRPVLTCNVSADAENLFKAFKGIGCDNKVVINVLTRRSSADRQKIVQEYSRRYGKSLIDRTVSEIYEPLERVLVSILYIGPDLDAYLLRKATKKLGTNETCLINILVTRSSFQITQIKESYTRLHNGKSLEKHIASDTSGNFQKILLFLLNTPRDQTTTCDPVAASEMASQIYSRSIIGMRAPDILIPIFCKTNYDQLRLMMQEFLKTNGRTVINYLKGFVNGYYEKTLISICSYVENPLHYFAKHLREGIQKLQINQVSRVVCSRCDIDLASILQDYEMNFKIKAQVELKQTFYAMHPATVDALLNLMGC